MSSESSDLENFNFDFKQRASHAKSSMESRVSVNTPKCHGCNKTVYHAEKIMCLGKPWHKYGCFKCKKCGKVLAIGSHSEHDGQPYCPIPCYSFLFGPKGFGRGGTESHKY